MNKYFQVNLSVPMRYGTSAMQILSSMHRLLSTRKLDESESWTRWKRYVYTVHEFSDFRGNYSYIGRHARIFYAVVKSFDLEKRK